MSNIIDDETAARLYNEIDITTGDDYNTKAKALEAWADAKDSERNKQDWDHLTRVYTDFDNYISDEGYSDLEEESRYRIANRQFIANQLGETVEDQNFLYPAKRDIWTQQAFGKKGLSEKETFGLIQQGVQSRNEVVQSANEIPGDIALGLFDSIGQGTAVEVPKLVSIWKERNAEKLKKLPAGWESGLLQAASDYATETEGMLRNYSEPLKQVYDHLASVTGRDTERAGETNPKSMQEIEGLADTLATMPPEVRDRAYAAVVLGAKQAGQEPKEFLEQWGESWSRTLNMFRSGSMVMQEDSAYSELQLLKEAPKVWKDTDTGKLTVYPGFDQSNAKEITPEERTELTAEAQKKFDRLQVYRELFNIADNQFDPIKKINEGGFGGFMEAMAYGSPQALAYTGMALVPGVGPWMTGAAIYSEEYNKLRLDGVNPETARSIAAPSAILQSGLERVGAKMIFGKLPAFEKLMTKIGNPARVGRAGSAGIRFGTAVVGENIVEGTQDLVTPVVQDVAAALGADVPDVDWGSTLGQWGTSRLDVLAATIPGILIGTGVATMSDGKRFNDFNERLDLYRTFGMDEAAIKRVEDNQTPQDRQVALQSEYKKLTPDNIKAGISYMESKMDEAKSMQEDPNLPTITREQGENGKPVFVVRDEKGAVAYRSEEEQAAMSAITQLFKGQLLNERNVVVDLRNQWLAEDPTNVAIESDGITAQQKLEKLQAAGNVAQIEELHRRIATSPYKDTPYEQINILGEATVEDLGEMVFRGVITLNQNSRPEDAREEMHHVAVRKALMKGSVTLDTLKGWLDATETALPDKFPGLVRDNENDIVESLARVQRAYEDGKINADEEMALPASFVDYIKRMLKAFKEVLQRAVALRGAFKQGILPGDYESFLAESVGLNQQTMVETTRERASGDIITDGGQMLMDFSIGSRSNAVSTDTPSIRASNATITGPANYSIAAHHGTPHKVDKFSTAKIGTGEGAQAYGWGLYFAQQIDVAQEYKDVLSSNQKYKDLGISPSPRVKTYLENAISQKFRIQFLKDDLERIQEDLQAHEVTAIDNFIKHVEANGYPVNKGNLYTVDLDVEPEDLLDWDKPLSDQSPKVQAALQSISGNWLWQDAISGKGGEQVGGALYSTLRATFPDAEFSRDGVDASKKASEALLAAGIPGIRYLDGGSRSEGQGTYNYVAFDENLIKITEENGNRIPASQALAAPATGATNYSISVQTTAANILADRLNIPTNLGPEYAGRQIIPIEADLTAGGGSFTQKPAQGGPAFSVIPQYYNAGVVWAAAKDGFWTGKLNLARESGAIYIGKDGQEKFMVAPYAMKQDSHISNPTVAGEKFSEVSRYIRENRITKAQEQGIFDLIQKSAVKGTATATSDLKTAKAAVAKAESDLKKAEALVKKSEKSVNKDKTEETEKALKSALKEFKTAESNLKVKKDSASEALAKKTFFEGIGRFPKSLTSNAFDTYLASLSFDQRKFLGEKLSSAEAEKLGAPPMDQIRRATLDESFAGVESLSLVSILEIDVKRLEEGLKNKTLTASAYGVTPHNSYNSLAPGKPVAFFRTPIPYSLAFPDIRAGLFGAGFNSNHGYFLKGKIPVGLPKLQKISSQMLSDWGDTQTSLRPNQAKAIVTALNQGWKTYTKPRQAGLAEFTRALRNNDAAVTLTQYSAEEVSQLLKEGKMKIFQLGDMNVWFALKRPGEGEAGDPKKDWHIVSVANNEKGSPGMLPLIMSKALAEGGTHLDCYAVKSSKYPDGLLPTLYAKSGFEATEVLPFDPQYHTEPGKMGELQKVWDSQKWNGQEKPPLVYMKWNPELHANLGTNASAENIITRKRSGKKNGRSVAGRADTSTGGDTSKAPVNMGGAGQGDQGRGVSDGSSPTGAAGDARNILPRGIEQIVADLGKLNDYQLEALGLTKSEVDAAIGIYNDPNSANYSIASQSEIDRVNRALGGMNRGPDERLKVYERAKQKFSKLMAWNSDELGAMADTGSDETQIRRTQLLQGLGELDAILQVLPPEVRGRVGGYTKLANIAPMDVFKDGVKVSESKNMDGAIISAWMKEGQNIGQAGKQVSLPPGYTAKENLASKRADKALADFFRDRIKKIDTELEKVLVREYTEAITKAVKQSRPKAGDNGVRKSTLGAETQKFADMVQRATLLDDEATPKRMAEIEAALANPDATAEDISALSEEWSILNTFGDLDNRSSETLAQGLDWLKGQLQMGREAWRIKEQARIDEQRARAAATIEWLGKGTAKKRFADKGLMQRIAEVGNNYLLDHASFEQFVTAMLPPEIAANFSERLRKADMAAQSSEIRDGKGILDAVREGAKAANMSAGDAMLWLKGDQKNAVAYLEGRKVKDERIAIDLAQKIVTGEADRSKLTDADVETLRNELAALPADTQKEFVTIKRVIFRGEDVKLDMSRAKAMQLLLSWSQPDVQIKMRKEGWTDESAADLKALVNDPVSRSVINYLQSLYGKGAGIVNPVYSRMFGMTMPQVKNYAPTRFLNAKDSKDIGLDGSPTATGTTPGFAKSRVTHSAKIAPEDALTVAQGHIAQQAHWVHFAELAREFRALLSSPDVRESLKQAHGDAVLKSAELWADQLEQRGGNKARESAWLNNVIGTAISGKAVASLGFNLKTLAMQLENTIRFGLSLDMKQIASALSNPSTIAEDIQTVWESDAIQNRLQGGATAEARFLFSRYAGKPNFAAKIAEASMTPINWLDSAGTSISSAIVYRANLNDALDAGMPENLAKQAALNAASEAIYRFAQPVSFGQKSIIENNGNVFAKTFFLFMSDPRLKTAILADAARGLSTGRGNASEHIRRIVAVELMALVSHVISSAFKDTFSDDDDEEIWGIGGFAKAMLLAPFQGFFFAGSVAEVALSKLTGQGYFTSSQNPLLNTAESAIRAGSNLDDAFNFNDPEAMLKQWNNIFRSMAVTPTMAAPAVLLNMVKPALGLYQNATTEE